MQSAQEIKITELNPHLICVLCGGYLIDASTIVHCLHSFCRSCIVQYFQTCNHCPICQILVHKKYPLLNLRSDEILQNVVYKIIPDIFKTEMKRRRDFYKSKCSDDFDSIVSSPETEGSRLIFSPDEMISLSLELCCRREDTTDNEELRVVRYLLCPAAVTIGHLKKFMKIKFSLSDTYRVDVYYADEILCDTYSLVDVAYISSWKRKDVLKLSYAVYENPAKRIKLTPSCETDVSVNDDSGIEDVNSSLDSINNTNSSFNDSCVSDELLTPCEDEGKKLPSQNDEQGTTRVPPQNETQVTTSDASPNLQTNNNDICDENCKMSVDPDCTPCNGNQGNTADDNDVASESEPCEYNYIMDQGDLIIDESVTSGDQQLDSSMEAPRNYSTKKDDICPMENHVTSTSVSEKQDKNLCDFGTQTSPYTNHVTDQSSDVQHTCQSDVIDYRKEQTSPISYRIKDRCTGVCNGHEVVKPREEKLVVKFSKERNSESYIIT